MNSHTSIDYIMNNYGPFLPLAVVALPIAVNALVAALKIAVNTLVAVPLSILTRGEKLSDRNFSFPEVALITASIKLFEYCHAKLITYRNFIGICGLSVFVENPVMALFMRVSLLFFFAKPDDKLAYAEHIYDKLAYAEHIYEKAAAAKDILITTCFHSYHACKNIYDKCTKNLTSTVIMKAAAGTIILGSACYHFDKVRTMGEIFVQTVFL